MFSRRDSRIPPVRSPYPPRRALHPPAPNRRDCPGRPLAVVKFSKWKTGIGAAGRLRRGKLRERGQQQCDQQDFFIASSDIRSGRSIHPWSGRWCARACRRVVDRPDLFECARRAVVQVRRGERNLCQWSRLQETRVVGSLARPHVEELSGLVPLGPHVGRRSSDLASGIGVPTLSTARSKTALPRSCAGVISPFRELPAIGPGVADGEYKPSKSASVRLSNCSERQKYSPSAARTRWAGWDFRRSICRARLSLTPSSILLSTMSRPKPSGSRVPRQTVEGGIDVGNWSSRSGPWKP